MSRSIKEIIIRNSLIVLLFTVLLILLVIGLSFRSLSKISVSNEILSISELVKAGLTAHMKAGIMDKRDYFLSEISTLYNVKQLKVIPSQYTRQSIWADSGAKYIESLDESQQAVMQGGKALFEFDDLAINPQVRALVPLKASEKGLLDCLVCHKIAADTVLGIVDMRIGFQEFRNVTVAYMAIVMIILASFAMAIIHRMVKVLDQDLIKPIHHLIAESEMAYRQKILPSQISYPTRELQDLAERIGWFLKEILNHQVALEQKNNEIKKSLVETAHLLGRVESFRSIETRNHTQRVARYCVVIASGIGMTEREIDLLSMASALHDIGKLGIPEDILHKKGALSNAEYEVMKKHTNIGFDILVHSEQEFLQLAARIALQHHERYDGQGYPFGLAGEMISIHARIVTIADVYDAISMPRSYKLAWNRELSLNYIKEHRGSHFDPEIVDIFFTRLADIFAIQEKYN